MIVQVPKLAHHFLSQRKIGSYNFGFENTYEKVLEIEDQLLCSEARAQVGDEYSELKNSFAQFQRRLRQVIVEAKRIIGSTICINYRFMTCLKSEH